MNITSAPSNDLEADCPTEFALERFRLDEVSSTPAGLFIGRHVAGCRRCQALLTEMRSAKGPRINLNLVSSKRHGSLAQRFQLHARSVGAFVARSDLRASMMLLLASTAAFLLMAKATPEVPAEQTKGSSWTLSVIARQPDGHQVRVEPGANLSTGDRLRFEVFTTWRRGNVVVISIDGAGAVSALAPFQGEAALVEGGHRKLLHETVELDEVLGPERIVLVGCKSLMKVETVVSAARSALRKAGGAPREINSLGLGCDEQSFWINKVAR